MLSSRQSEQLTIECGNNNAVALNGIFNTRTHAIFSCSTPLIIDVRAPNLFVKFGKFKLISDATRAGLVEALRSWRTAHPRLENEPVVSISDRMLRHFKDDLIAAGLARTVIRVDDKGRKREHIDTSDASGRVIDLHALRHTFGTRLGRMPGIDPKSVQTLMRHSDPRLTFGIYVHADKARLAAAVAMLPEIKVAQNPAMESGCVTNGLSANGATPAPRSGRS